MRKFGVIFQLYKIILANKEVKYIIIAPIIILLDMSYFIIIPDYLN